MATTEIHTTAPTVSENAVESTFFEVDDRDRAIPAIEFRNVVLAFDDRVILDGLSFTVMKGETKIILVSRGWKAARRRNKHLACNDRKHVEQENDDRRLHTVRTAETDLRVALQHVESQA